MTRYTIRYRSHITGSDALYETFFVKDVAYEEARKLRERCMKFDNKQTASSVFVEEKD